MLLATRFNGSLKRDVNVSHVSKTPKKTLEGGLCLPLIMIYTTKITKIHLRKIMIKSFVNFPSNV